MASTDDGIVDDPTNEDPFDDDPREAYFLRLQKLVIDIGTDAVRAAFNKHVLCLPMILRCNTQAIQNLKKKRIISDKQLDILQKEPYTSEKYDISLLVALLRNIVTSTRKSKQLWVEVDNSNVKGQDDVANIVRIRNIRNEVVQHLHHAHIARIEADDYNKKWDELEKAIVMLGMSCNRTDYQQKIERLKTKTLEVISPEVKGMRSYTISRLEDFRVDEEPFYQSTSVYRKATEVLDEKNMVILTGPPGEGKTTMAFKLALDKSSSRNCLILKSPLDWRKVDWSLKLFHTIIIDDIFGRGSLKRPLFDEWNKYLSEIEKAATRKFLRVIITSRHHILEECREDIDIDVKTFQTENDDRAIVLLTSKGLNEDERTRILRSQAGRNDVDIPDERLKQLVMASLDTDFYSKRRISFESFAFGFPECARMFMKSNNMHKLGINFFREPAILFKRYLEELYRGSGADVHEKFLALVAVWAAETNPIVDKELWNLKPVQITIQRVVDLYCRRDLDFELLLKIHSSLKSHICGYLELEESGEFKFSHNIIGDMVGVVLGKKRLDVAIKLSPRDFLMEHITIQHDKTNSECTLTVHRGHFNVLAEKFIDTILKINSSHTCITDYQDFFSLMRRRVRPNKIEVVDTLDFGVINHEAFNDATFVGTFLTCAQKKEVIQQLFMTPVMQLSGYFLEYGINQDKMTMCLAGYAFFKKRSLFAQEVFKKMLSDVSIDPTTSLLFATHTSDIKTMKCLIDNGANVTGDTLYIAIHKKNIKVLETLIFGVSVDVNHAGNIVHGNTPLMVAVKKNNPGAVRLLLDQGGDNSIRSEKNLSALYKSVLYQRHRNLHLLLERRPYVDEKCGKFKRTALHIAADKGDHVAVSELLKYGADVKAKDHRRHYPIHLAAIQGHCMVVKLLLDHDKSQETLRISSYGRKSFIKGMSLYHIAVWKNNIQLLQTLADCGANPNIQDIYGQTPLYFSIKRWNSSITRFLIKLNGVDKERPQKQGFTPLHAAVHVGDKNIVKLLAPSVKVNAQDRYGKTPLHVACEKGHLDIAVFLVLKCRADWRMVTRRGDTVCHILRRRWSRADHRIIEYFLHKHDPTLKQHLATLKNRNGTVISKSKESLGKRDLSRYQSAIEDASKEAYHYEVDDARRRHHARVAVARQRLLDELHFRMLLRLFMPITFSNRGLLLEGDDVIMTFGAATDDA